MGNKIMHHFRGCSLSPDSVHKPGLPLNLGGGGPLALPMTHEQLMTHPQRFSRPPLDCL